MIWNWQPGEYAFPKKGRRVDIWVKRILAGPLVGLLVTGMLTGCGGSTATSSADNGLAASAAPKKVIIWDYFETDVQKEMMKMMINGLNAGQKEHVTKHIYIPSADYEKQLTLGTTSKQLPDLMILNGCSMASFISMGLFADILNADVKWDEYIASSMEFTMMDGEHCGIPFATNCMALFYDKDLFGAVGLKYPDENTTRGEFRRMAKTLTKNGMYGFGSAATSIDKGTFQCLQWLYTTSGSYKNIEGDVDAYKLMQEVVKEGSWTEEIVNWTQSDVNNNFMTGNLTMQQNGSWQIPDIGASAPDLDYGVTVLPKKDVSSPQATSIPGGENMDVVRKDDVSGVLASLKYYGKTDIMVQVMKQYSSFPPKTEAAKDACWIKGPIRVTFIKQLDTSIPREPSPLWSSYPVTVRIGFQEVLVSAKTLEQAAQDTQAIVDAVKQDFQKVKRDVADNIPFCKEESSL